MSKRSRRNKRREAEEVTLRKGEVLTLPAGYRAIQAADAPKSFRLCGASEPLELEAAAEGDAAAGKPKRFSMTAYTGAAMRVGYGWPVVVDLAGIRVPNQATPIFRNHDADRIVGHTTKVDVTAQRIKVAGEMSGDPDQVDPIVASAGRGFPWQASIGASVERMEYVDRDETVKVNGRTFTGPVYVARASTLGEISFVPLGADSATSASVAAGQSGEPSMNPFEKWLAAKGFDPSALTESQKLALKAAFDAEQAPPAKAEEKPAPNPAGKPGGVEADIEAQNLKMAENRLRNLKIQEICAKFEHPTVSVDRDGEKAEMDLEAHALATKMTVQEVEIAALYAHMKKNTGNTNTAKKSKPDVQPGEVVEAAICMTGNLGNVEKRFKPEVLEAADRHFGRGFGIQQLLLHAAAANGMSLGPAPRVGTGNLLSVLRAAFDVKAHGFSTVPLPGILSNIANKFLLEAYMSGDESWRSVARIGSVKDLKTITKFRMTGGMKFEKLAPGGEIKHGKVSEQEFTNRAHTYARLEYLTEEDIINDDLGAFADVPAEMGRGAIDALNEAFWTEWLENAGGFYSATPVTTDMAKVNSNLSASSALGVTGLTNAKTTFLKQVKPDGTPINVTPYAIVFPPELQDTATTLLRDRELRDTTANTKFTTGNPHAGINLVPVMSPYLSNANITNNSATTWYLAANPAQVAAIEVVFLNGQQTPMIQSADADFNRLGIGVRGKWYFGVRKQDRRGVVQCTA